MKVSFNEEKFTKNLFNFVVAGSVFVMSFTNIYKQFTEYLESPIIEQGVIFERPEDLSVLQGSQLIDADNDGEIDIRMENYDFDRNGATDVSAFYELPPLINERPIARAVITYYKYGMGVKEIWIDSKKNKTLDKMLESEEKFNKWLKNMDRFYRKKQLVV